MPAMPAPQDGRGWGRGRFMNIRPIGRFIVKLVMPAGSVQALE